MHVLLNQGLTTEPLIPHLLKLTPLTKAIRTPASAPIPMLLLTWHLPLKIPNLSHQRNLDILSCPPVPQGSPEIRRKMFIGKNNKKRCHQHMQVKPPLALSGPYRNAGQIASVSCLKPFNTAPLVFGFQPNPNLLSQRTPPKNPCRRGCSTL